MIKRSLIRLIGFSGAHAAQAFTWFLLSDKSNCDFTAARKCHYHDERYLCYHSASARRKFGRFGQEKLSEWLHPAVRWLSTKWRRIFGGRVSQLLQRKPYPEENVIISSPNTFKLVKPLLFQPDIFVHLTSNILWGRGLSWLASMLVKPVPSQLCCCIVVFFAYPFLCLFALKCIFMMKPTHDVTSINPLNEGYLCVCARLASNLQKLWKNTDKMAPKICSRLKTTNTRAKTSVSRSGESDAWQTVTFEWESWCERSDSCELEGQGGDQWVSRWVGEGWRRQESPGLLITPGTGPSHPRQLCLFCTDLWMKHTLQPPRLGPCSPFFICTEPAGRGMKTLRLTGLLFKGCGKFTRPLTWKLREHNLITIPSSR